MSRNIMSVQRLLPAHKPDILLAIVVALIIIGLLMIYSSTLDLGYLAYENSRYYVERQALWVLVGAAAMAVVAVVDYHIWQRLAVPLILAMIVALILVFPLGKFAFGAQRSLLENSIQPGEACKLATIVYVAVWLSSKGDKIRQVKLGLVPFAVIVGLIAGLILLQPSFTTASIIVLIAGAMFFVAGADLRQFVAAGVIVAGVFAGLAYLAPYRMARVQAYLDPLADPWGKGWQVVQALKALADGGLWGQGLGTGRALARALPVAHTDNIFAYLGLEVGLIGCLVIVGLYLALAVCGFGIASQARDRLGEILATGITFWLAGQAFLNIAVVTAMVPTTGVPLPFISYGGSSLVVSMAGVGLLLNISRLAVKRGSKEKVSGQNRHFRWWNRRPRVSSSGHR